MKKLKPNQEIWPSIVLIVFASIVIAFCFASCATIQKQAGYEHYTKNTHWK